MCDLFWEFSASIPSSGVFFLWQRGAVRMTDQPLLTRQHQACRTGVRALFSIFSLWTNTSRGNGGKSLSGIVGFRIWDLGFRIWDCLAHQVPCQAVLDLSREQGRMWLPGDCLWHGLQGGRLSLTASFQCDAGLVLQVLNGQRDSQNEGAFHRERPSGARCNARRGRGH